MMNSRFARRLISFGKEHRALRIPVMIVMVFYLIFHNIFVFLNTHKKQLIAAASVLIIFAGTVSFAPSSRAATQDAIEAAEAEDTGSAYFYTDQGVVEVDEVEIEEAGETGEAATGHNTASADDIERLLGETEKAGKVRPHAVTGAGEGTLIYDEEKGMTEAGFDDDWSLILINKKHRIPADYEFELSTIKGAIKSDVRVTRYVLDMIKGAEEDGVKLYICSPYRDFERQEELFNKKVKSYLRKGYEFDEAYELASQTVAIPGSSEHQAGLAFDFITEDYTVLEAGFADTAAGKWLKENAADYGFILRYPADKEAITEIEFEPWHYRFVGEAAAHEIMDRGLCLEEYVSEIGLVEN